MLKACDNALATQSDVLDVKGPRVSWSEYNLASELQVLYYENIDGYFQLVPREIGLAY